MPLAIDNTIIEDDDELIFLTDSNRRLTVNKEQAEEFRQKLNEWAEETDRA